MNTFALVSTIMTPHTELVTVSPEDSLQKVKEIFDTHKFHHIPVVRFREIVGLVSKTDFMFFLGGASLYDEDRFENESRLNRAHVKDIMTTGLGKLEPDDRINVALEVFCKNWFHALPVVQNGDLVGIVTPFDIMKYILDEKPKAPHMVYEPES